MMTMNFDTMRQAIKAVQEMSESATAEIGDCEVWQYDNGDVEIVEPGTDLSDAGDSVKLVGLVREVLY
jgi:hypothetical protein